MYVQLETRDFQLPLSIPPALILSPENYSWDAIGGPVDAKVAVLGSAQDVWRCVEWLRCPISIVVKKKVWWGYIAEVEITVGRFTVGVSLDSMQNKICIKYTTPAISGGDALTTSYLQDDDSVATYGAKEHIISMSDITTAVAEQRRTMALAQTRYPIQTVRSGGTSGTPKATLHCRGWYKTAEWRRYSQAAGYEAHEPTSTSASYKIGLGQTSILIGFRAGTKKIHDIAGKLGNFKSDDRIVVSGSTSNNGTYTVDSSTSAEIISYTNTTINFSSGVQINDTAAQMGQFAAGDLIKITGSVANDGYYTVASVGSAGTHLLVDQALVNGPAGPSITIARGHAITVVETLVNEMPGASITVQMESAKIAQSFVLPGGVTNWTIDQVQIRIRKVGAPVDSVALGLRTDSAGSPGTLLDAGSILASEMTDGYEWRAAEDMDNLVTMDGSTYWLAVGRVGAIDPDNYYEIAVDEDATYTSGQLKVLVGATYVDPPTPTDMVFKIIGAWETTRQIQEIVAACCPFILGVDIVDASGVSFPQYREGDNTGWQEILDLLEMGAADGSRMLAYVTKERYLRVYKEPAKGVTTDWSVDVDDVLRNEWDVVVDNAACPVGFWMAVNVIPATTNTARLASASPIFVECSEYNVESQELNKEQKNVASPWDVGGIRQG